MTGDPGGGGPDWNSGPPWARRRTTTDPSARSPVWSQLSSPSAEQTYTILTGSTIVLAADVRFSAAPTATVATSTVPAALR